jgi:hypothetical protein
LGDLLAFSAKEFVSDTSKQIRMTTIFDFSIKGFQSRELF